MTEYDPVLKYIQQYSSGPSEVLRNIERETFLKTLAPQMISGKTQGRFLSMISRILKPKRILEIGTFTGYGSICLAEGLDPAGQVITIEANRELERTIISNIQKADLTKRIRLIVGQAEDVIPTLPEGFDLVFIDAGKKDYGLFLRSRFREGSIGRIYFG